MTLKMHVRRMPDTEHLWALYVFRGAKKPVAISRSIRGLQQSVHARTVKRLRKIAQCMA